MVFGLLFSSSSSLQNDPVEEDKHQQASDHVLVTVIAKRPRALVVLLGHMGATVDQISKYAQLYHDNKCSTVCATAPILSLASNDTIMMGEIAITACRETARLIRMAELAEMGFGRVPVIVHVLGNGGAQILEEMEKRIDEVIPKSHLKSIMICGTTPLSNSSISSRRTMMMKSGSNRSLMMKCGSTRSLMTASGGGSRRNLMNTKSTVNSGATFKGSTRSLLTSTSLSSDEEEGENVLPVDTTIKEEYEHLQTKMACHAPIVTTSVSSSEIGDVLDQTCIVEYSGGCSHNGNLSPRAMSLLPPCMGSTTTLPVSNILDRRLQQRRRRRKRDSLNVKRIDVERAGLPTSSSPRYNQDDRAYKRDIELFASRLILGSLVFDSGPYFPSIENELAAVSLLLTNTTAATRLMANSTIVGSHGWNGITSFTYLGSEGGNTGNDAELGGRPTQFWNNMQNVELSKRHAFIYSRGDTICHRDELKKLIALQEQNGKQVLQIELLTTRHLEHRSRRADKYCDFVEKVLNSVEGHRMDVCESVDDWFDSDDEDAVVETGHEAVREQGSGVVKIAPATKAMMMPCATTAAAIMPDTTPTTVA